MEASRAVLTSVNMDAHGREPVVHRGSMGWKQAGLILYAFAAPSAVMAVPYAIGMAGFVGGMLICLVITTASVTGAMMLLQVKLRYPECNTFGDLGFKVLGRPGQIWGNAIQLTNFLLFMPCALQFCALALEGIGTGIPGFGGCNDYYVFTLAVVCLLTTQARTFSNTQVLSCISAMCVLAMAIIMLVAAFKYEKVDKVPAYFFGNPEPDLALSLLKASGGFTINVWAFVPAFLTVELSTCMENPKDFQRSLVFSGILNVAVFFVVGVTVVARWGYDVGEVIPITAGVGAWKAGAALNTAFNSFQLVGNFISYMLDSVPLGRFCQKSWAPTFQDSWSLGDNFRYLSYTLPAFLFALFLSVAVPSVNTLLDFTTAITIPWVTQIYPAVIYWKLRRGDEALLQQDKEQPNMSSREKVAIALVGLVGSISFVVCSAKAIGYVAYDELRPPMSIGCADWTIWKSR